MSIKTDKSFLSISTFDDIKLVDRCIEDIKNVLIDNPPIVVYGKKCYQHRSVGFFSNISKSYRYSNQQSLSIPLSNNMIILLDNINKIFNAEFNGILVNRYKDGSDYISMHSDDEKCLDNIGVVALSAGAVRTFRIRNKERKIISNIKLNPYTIVHMGGDFQKEFFHEIPIEKNIKDARYSFTFRKHLN